MKIPAPSDPSLRLVNPPIGAGRGESLVAGALVSAVVRERIDPGLYRISIGGALYTAASAHDLSPGMTLKARVERAGDALLLRLASPLGREAALASALTAAALPNDPAARAAVAALLREGMAPEPRALARVRRAALREAAEGGEWTDLAAKLEAKGIAAEGAALEGLAAAAEGRSWGGGHGGGEGGGGDGGGGQGGPGDGGGGGGGEPPRLEPGTELPVTEGDLPRVLGALLRSLATRADAPGLDSASLGLSLFNHRRGPEGSWIIVPFRFALDEVDFAGSFRIQLPYVQGGSGRFEARFSASRAAVPEDWSLSLDFGGGRAKALRVDAPDGSPGSGVRYTKFAAELAALGCPVGFGGRGEPAEGESAERGLDLDA